MRGERGSLRGGVPSSLPPPSIALTNLLVGYKQGWMPNFRVLGAIKMVVLAGQGAFVNNGQQPRSQHAQAKVIHIYSVHEELSQMPLPDNILLEPSFGLSRHQHYEQTHRTKKESQVKKICLVLGF